MPIRRENTIKIDFKSVKKKPQNIQLHRWIKEKFQLTIDQVMAIQYDHIYHNVYIKLISEMLVKKIVQMYKNGSLSYEDEENKIHEVFISEDVSETIIKAFDFPLELHNAKIKETFNKYGIVKTIRQEKWIGEDLYQVDNGIRTIIMILEKNIPSYVTIEGCTSFISYKGQERTCMFCDQAGHERKNCPKNKRRTETNRPNVPIPNDETLTYADIVNTQNIYNDRAQEVEIEETEYSEESDTSEGMEKRHKDEITPVTIVQVHQEDNGQSIQKVQGNENENLCKYQEIREDTVLEDIVEDVEDPNGIEFEDILEATQENKGMKRTKKIATLISSSEEERKVPKLTINMKAKKTGKKKKGSNKHEKENVENN